MQDRKVTQRGQEEREQDTAAREMKKELHSMVKEGQRHSGNSRGKDRLLVRE